MPVPNRFYFTPVHNHVTSSAKKPAFNYTLVIASVMYERKSHCLDIFSRSLLSIFRNATAGIARARSRWQEIITESDNLQISRQRVW